MIAQSQLMNVTEIDQDVAISLKKPNYSSNELSSHARILNRLAAEVGDNLYSLWFASDDCIALENDNLVVIADSDFELRRIQRGFGTQLRQIAAEVTGGPTRVIFRVRENLPESTNFVGSNQVNDSVVADAGTKIRQPHFDGKPTRRSIDSPLERTRREQRAFLAPRQPLLNDFYFGPENDFLRAAVNQVVQSPGQFSPLLIHGGSGSGKSHLLEALTGELRKRHRLNSCLYVTAEHFTSFFLQSLRGTGLPMFRRKYRDVDVLAIDDIQFFANKRATIAELQYTLDHLIRNGKQVILSSDRSPLELIELGHEVVNRVNSGLACTLNFAEGVSRENICRRLCRERNLEWSDSVIRLIAERSGRDGRRISGAINQICAASQIRDCTVDEFLVDNLIPATHTSNCRLTTIPQVERAVCELFGVGVSEIRSTSRAKRVSSARMLAMWLCREHTSAALSEIGDHFGKRSHSTVIAARNRVEEMLQKDETIALPIGHQIAKEVLQTISNKLNLN
ncbi:MAG: DnaA/Hda family protein [Pirellulaceae bacterium]